MPKSEEKRGSKKNMEQEKKRKSLTWFAKPCRGPASPFMAAAKDR